MKAAQMKCISIWLAETSTQRHYCSVSSKLAVKHLLKATQYTINRNNKYCTIRLSITSMRHITRYVWTFRWMCGCFVFTIDNSKHRTVPVSSIRLSNIESCIDVDTNTYTHLYCHLKWNIDAVKYFNQLIQSVNRLWWWNRKDGAREKNEELNEE